MPLDKSKVFPPEALEANRRGQLTDAQLQGFRGLSRYRRKDQLSWAGYLVGGGGLLIAFFASPSTSRLFTLTNNVLQVQRRQLEGAHISQYFGRLFSVDQVRVISRRQRPTRTWNENSACRPRDCF